MFDIGADELLLTAVVAVVVIGPKDLPKALRVVGRWVAKMRRMSNSFRAGIENVIREAELEEMEKQWREQNAAIMAQHPTATPDDEAAAATAASYGEPPALPPADPLPVPDPVSTHPLAEGDTAQDHSPAVPAPRPAAIDPAP
ncbi:twin-arginine translocase subunit TatB [Novosphingobium flavum]|uniref:Sec-independent protein translocase protein TatB n=1 Tax=Novosphingobium flavum TaxID=1778672 RepID=A0A7X1FSE1_9SPHN|nr:Sec-independent protein translocase protein TatB [Novosphingobium flavum]MBC2665964.1 twin-arginine translocase subunit TatB [Novosphingobium flavum]